MTILRTTTPALLEPRDIRSHYVERLCSRRTGRGAAPHPDRSLAGSGRVAVHDGDGAAGRLPVRSKILSC